MQVTEKQGYKHTDLGWVPDEWEVEKLGEVCDVRDGTHDSPKYHAEGVPFITSKNLKNGKIDLTEVNFISEQDHINFSKRSNVENGDILFGMIGTVGSPVIVNTSFKFSIKNVALLKFSNNVLNNVFTLNLINSELIEKQFRMSSNGGVQSFVALGTIRKLIIPLPPIQEQQKIADILSIVDEKIDCIDEQIEKTQELKKGLMQKLLTEGIGHTEFKDSPLGRIPAVWDIEKLGDVLKIGSGRDYKHLKDGDFPVYGTGGYMTSVNEYLYDGKSVGIGRKGTIDKPVFLNGKFWTVDTLFYTHSFKSVIPYFIFIVFQSINWRSYNEATGVPSLSKTIIEAIKIAIPPLKEQQKIAEILSTIDDKLETLQTKKSEYTQLKKGLMQKLLTGQIRVRV